MAQEGYPWGGSEPLWASAAEHLARRGSEVRVSAKDWGEPVPEIERLRAAGCEIFYRRDRYRLPSFISRQIQRIFPPPKYLDVHVQTVGADADLVVVSQGCNFDGLEWMEAVRSAGFRYAVISQGAAEQWWPVDDTAERLRASHESASATYFVSQANLDMSRRQFGSPLNNAKVVRNPFNVRYDAQPPWPSELALRGRIVYLSQPLNYFRFHDQSVRGRDIGYRVVAKESLRVVRWLLDQVTITDAARGRLCQTLSELWVQAVVTSHVPLGLRWTILRNAMAIDPRAIRRVVRRGLVAVRIKIQKHRLFSRDRKLRRPNGA